MKAHSRFPVLAILALVMLAAACRSERRQTSPLQMVAGGDAARGEDTFERYGCTSCHTIPGVRMANGRVGPPLNFWSQRRYIAGEVPNRPDLLIQFIKDPQSISPRTAMPGTGVDDRDARDMAAYLYRLN